ncbi:hypothetical protein M427DRAFT_54122 [Gonapodya prolifera JEL478]|uniref:AN1-type domain-containing protein n=1 Tax=Gonapodya prolifera (strain JEL478) TaxID=1344416 RepID=A0A139AMS0_GONPJ|nr:hypothetical protein M427DRAFT_54122 [Gonapodya prolifera JEL478]|eukprot:KXS17874.1 hypothetical protein M427DRAFT_54122 [Gonapodya prolifera JEL478]
MELPNVGIHCALPTCNQLDFLPFKCQYCFSKFCQDHWKVDAHDCKSKPPDYLVDARTTVCPLCDKVVSVARGDDPNEMVDLHIRLGCPPTLPSSSSSSSLLAPTPSGSTLGTSSCPVPRCNYKGPVVVRCENCGVVHCVRHRNPRDHSCPSLSSRTPSPNPAVASKPLSSTVPSAAGRGASAARPPAQTAAAAAAAARAGGGAKAGRGASAAQAASRPATAAAPPTRPPPTRNAPRDATNLSESEQLALAMELSRAQAEEDEQMALALALSKGDVPEGGTGRGQGNQGQGGSRSRRSTASGGSGGSGKKDDGCVAM